MRHRLAIAVLFFAFSTKLAAQAQVQPSAVVPRATLASTDGSICDGSAMRGAEQRRWLGDGVMIASLPIGLFGVSSNHHSPGDALSVIGVSAGVFLTGAFLHWSSYPNDSFWDAIVSRAKPGVTRIGDVRSCLHSPDLTNIAGADQHWEYSMRKPLVEGWTRTYRAVSFTFKDSVLVDVRRREVRYHPHEVPPSVTAAGIP